MAKPAARVGFIQFCLTLGTLGVLARAAQLQLVQGDHWAQKASETRTVREAIAARRGSIYDRGGKWIVVSDEQYRVSIAPEQVRDTVRFSRAVAKALDASPAELQRKIRGGRRSIYFHGPYDALAVEEIRGLAGVHLAPVYPRGGQTNLARQTIGVLDLDTGHGISGIERTLDSLLSGIPGEVVWLTDPTRRSRIASPGRPLREPVRGNDVWLTLDTKLQEIAEAALDRAIDELDAKGGDVIFLDPATGELLAVASRVEGERSAATAFTAPFEPGSTAKLFTAAALLEHDLVDSTDRVDGENGIWTLETARGASYRITDVHIAEEPMNLEMAVALSSNIGLAKFAQRLEPGLQYDMLRRFGFGSHTGVEFPVESSGGVPNPANPATWVEGYTRESISRGYNFQVTAIQLAAAYGAIANGGILYAPTLVREVRSPEGEVLYRHRPEPVRRVLSPEVAATLRRYMRKAVSTSSTDQSLQIEEYALAGKTGTARKVVNGRYVSGKYVSSFAAIWPADRPELVIIVSIDEPKGAYYGSQTAAPLTRDILTEAIASRNQALDFDQLATRDSTRRNGSPAPRAEPAKPRRTPVIAVSWPLAKDLSAREVRPVPDVSGQPARTAIARLHAEGFRVAVEGLGNVASTVPSAGSAVRTGETITIHAEAPRLP
ncbi:MAG TPA: penicillin-binding transpeptidase domain-containing protein [Gemmatimonadales bacterium]|nr:penicillin-binding transpeptidase domain-containing protein [Gemmatimonadales bacterium]